jgi:methylamine utilization protein MauE
LAGAASVCACVLALVFAWAAVAKLVARHATAAGFAALGVPLPGVASVGVPVVEVGVAVVLVVRPSVGAALALALLALFTLVVVRAVASGSRAGCACFGARRVEPVSPADVVRNGLLAAFAAVATGTTRLVRPDVEAVAAVVVAIALGGLVLRVAQRRLGVPAP